MYQIKIDGKVIYSHENLIPTAFRNVEVYVSDPWHPPVEGKLQNILIENRGMRVSHLKLNHLNTETCKKQASEAISSGIV